MRDALRRYVHFIAYVVFCLFVWLAISLTQRNGEEDIRREQAQQAIDAAIQHEALVQVCKSNLELRTQIRDFVSAGRPTPIPPNADPALIEAINRANERAEESKRKIQEQFADPPCVRVLPEVTTTTTEPRP